MGDRGGGEERDACISKCLRPPIERVWGLGGLQERFASMLVGTRPPLKMRLDPSTPPCQPVCLVPCC